jgi:propanol-preferring alcohol dehydrogenase
MGKVAFIGESKSTEFNPSEQFIRKTLQVIGSWYFPTWEYEEIANFMISSNMHPENLVTHTFSLDQAKEAYELFDNYETGIVVFIN